VIVRSRVPQEVSEAIATLPDDKPLPKTNAATSRSSHTHEATVPLGIVQTASFAVAMQSEPFLGYAWSWGGHSSCTSAGEVHRCTARNLPAAEPPIPSIRERCSPQINPKHIVVRRRWPRSESPATSHQKSVIIAVALLLTRRHAV